MTNPPVGFEDKIFSFRTGSIPVAELYNDTTPSTVAGFNELANQNLWVNGASNSSTWIYGARSACIAQDAHASYRRLFYPRYLKPIVPDGRGVQGALTFSMEFKDNGKTDGYAFFGLCTGLELVSSAWVVNGAFGFSMKDQKFFLSQIEYGASKNIQPLHKLTDVAGYVDNIETSPTISGLSRTVYTKYGFTVFVSRNSVERYTFNVVGSINNNPVWALTTPYDDIYDYFSEGVKIDHGGFYPYIASYFNGTGYHQLYPALIQGKYTLG